MTKPKPKAASKKPPKAAKQPMVPGMPGRPSSFTPEIAAEICESIANNMSLVAWANGRSLDDRDLEQKVQAPGKGRKQAEAELMRRRAARQKERPGYRTINDWLREYENFDAAYRLAIANRADYQFEEMIDIADNVLLEIEDRKVRLDTRKWTASRMNRAKYGDRVDLITPPSDANDDQKLAELGALLAQAAGKAVIGEGLKALERLGVKLVSSPKL